ncbi:MAG: ROK family transcriptional regulator [Oscillospiraceae bacterium]|nr:ROK family transcriptional regulator [Oscillospiraceae bacterium]
MNEKGSNHQLLKQNNHNLIKKHIYRNSPISRVEIAQQLGLTTATITGMVNPMINSGLLRETVAPTDEAKGAGRPRMMLEFVPEAYYVCGVDVGVYNTNYILTDIRGNVIAVRHTDQPLGDYRVTLEWLAQQIPAFLEEAAIPKEKVLGVGICLPGMIDGSADIIYDIFYEGWTEHNLCAELGQRLGLNVEVENNVRARAISAELFDRMVKSEPFAYFFVSFGVACQMIIDGKVLYGQSAAAGEIGHTVVQRNGPVCPTCGNRGCLEALTGERAILQQCRDIMAAETPTILRDLCPDPQCLTMDQVLLAQEMGDKAVSSVIEDAIEYLGIALANTINLISPRAVVLEGRILSVPKNQARMLRTVEQYMFHIHSGMIDFAFLPYDSDRGARAAAAVVVKEFLSRSL